MGVITLGSKIDDRKKRLVVNACANTTRMVVEALDREINIKEERIKRYKEKYLSMERRYTEMEKKYETLVRRETKEEETQTCREAYRGTEVVVVENRDKGLEEKMDSLIKRIDKLERRISCEEENINREEENVNREEEGEIPWTKVLGRRRKIEKEKERKK